MYPELRHALLGAIVCTGVVLLFAFVFALLRPKMMNSFVIAVLLVAGLAVMGSSTQWRSMQL